MANLVLMVIEGIMNAHNLSPSCVVKQGDTVQFEVWGLRGNHKCWATMDGLTVGGKGPMTGSLSEALVAVCYSVR